MKNFVITENQLYKIEDLIKDGFHVVCLDDNAENENKMGVYIENKQGNCRIMDFKLAE